MMKTTKQATIALAALGVLAGVSAASATNLSETIRLSPTQRHTAWNDLNAGATNQNAGSFTPEMGAILPSGVKVESVPSKAANAVPELNGYGYAMVDHQIVIANPKDKVIAYVLKG
jgi:hypothetical protein